MSTVQQTIRRQRAEAQAQDEANLLRLVETYGNLYDRMGGDIDALLSAIEELDNPTQAQIKALPEYRRLVRHATNELDRFTIHTDLVIESSAVAAVALGLLHSQEWVNAAGGGKTGLSSRTVIPLLDYLKQGGPLYQRLELLTGSTVNNVTETIINGVLQGFNPRRIAADIQDAFGGGLTDALRNTRTVQLWSYRDAARANYTASNGIVTGWIWYAELDADTCPSCVAMHGTVHDLDETLDDHYNGRCAALPYIEGLTDDVQTGEEWFNGLDTETQKAILGDSKHAALQDGKFEFSQLSQQVPNEVYKTMRVATSLADLLVEE